MKKIVVLDVKTLGDVEFDRLKEFGEVKLYDATSQEQVRERVKNANIILTNKVVLNSDNLSEANNLELICETATGFNNIDIDYARSKGISVTNVAGYSTNSVVQHTFAMALTLLDEVAYYDNYIKSGKYSKSGEFTSLDKPFYELYGKTWGIMGMGNIGKKVAQIADVFGAKVVYFSTSGKNNSSDYTRVSFDELLESCDVISIHAPLNDNTLGIMNYEAFCKMKSTAILVNMGRGPIVVEKDLARAIDEERIRGAALDVFEVEPIAQDNPLISLKNKDRLVLSPHIAWASIESRERLFNEVIENIKAFYKNENRNRVDL
jgi:glycerate dehydrogenase